MGPEGLGSNPHKERTEGDYRDGSLLYNQSPPTRRLVLQSIMQMDKSDGLECVSAEETNAR